MLKLSVTMKQDVAPLQANEANVLRKKLASFDVKQHEFRENFRKTAPFTIEAKGSYARIDRVSTCMYICMLYFISVYISITGKCTNQRNGGTDEFTQRSCWII